MRAVNPGVDLRASWGRRRATRKQSVHTVVSADGTTLGYRRLGDGPGLILLHGGMMASQNFVKLGAALADAFTVFIPDRRGRGMTGAFGERYSLAVECEDVRALVAQTGASNVFGLSSGAVIALLAALVVGEIRKVAAYEPPFAVPGFDPAHWAPRFDHHVKQGNLAAAMLTVIKGTGDSRLLKAVPHFLLIPILSLAIRENRRECKDGEVPIADLIPTMHYDAQVVTEASASFENLKGLRSDALLVGGSKSARFFRPVFEALAKVLPQAERIELPGVGHTAADNEGDPELVATALRRFYSPCTSAPRG
jgi:pimeloyl-ACP methyl ester carboxylesterase